MSPISNVSHPKSAQAESETTVNPASRRDLPSPTYLSFYKRPLMATNSKPRAQNRKRKHTEADLSQNDLPALPSKKFKSTKELFSANRFPPPTFWDSLSKVWLTRRALRELDRRNQSDSRARASAPAPRPIRQYSDRKYLQRFARHGGPELGDLQGHLEPTGINLAHIISFKCSSRSSRSFGSKGSKFTNPTSNSASETNTEGSRRRSSAYDAGFEQHLIDNGVYRNSRKSKPSNLDEMRQILARPRPSLSLSSFSETAFEKFQQFNEDVINEDEVMRKVLSILYGDADIPNQQNLLFTRLESITNETTVMPKPDFYDGARLEDIDKHVVEDIDRCLPKYVDKHPENQNSFVIPTKHRTAPVAPNFFLEAKSPKGGVDVAKRQACLDGTLGARAMHKLQSYAAGEPVYDSNAYTLMSMYHAGTGTLQMYATHVTPTGPGDSPEYHMTQTGAQSIVGSRDQYLQGAAAFRNGRDWTKEKRDQFISAANERARSTYAEPSTLKSSNCGDVSDTPDSYPIEESQASVDELTAALFAHPIAEPDYDDLTDITEERYEEHELSADELVLEMSPNSTPSKNVQIRNQR